jgi:probable rRNA maturation factor
MAVSVIIDVRDARWKKALRPYRKTVIDVCNVALAACKIKQGELAVVLADDDFVQQLNATYRGKNKPTNVLSFEGEDDALGDIVLAFETIEKEAKNQKKLFRDHAAHLVVHGVLHLFGHDHMKQNEADVMEAMEIKILKKLGVANPYL